ncbi:transmembrane protease serine 6 [Aplysia californica]|uniref:Transmembrane protease serine 6 n=1 Tax=Aplysia californica TaxID=6500 RepID=A0ABM0JC00_APLCA|nr:transmembrane protease serine 6 [Aplysia californica]
MVSWSVSSSLVLLWTLLVVQCHGHKHNIQADRVKRTIGGESFSRGTWPWLALLRATIVTNRLFGFFPVSHYHLYCGGVLISDRWILSAAHCFTENGEPARRPWNWEARLASVRLRPSIRERVLDVVGRVFDQNELRQWEISLDRIVVHPGYNASSLFSDDIALVRLSRPVPNPRRFSLIQNVTLPDANDNSFPMPGEVCVTKGWGCTARGGGPSTRAHQVEMPIYPASNCLNSYNLITMERRLCAGHRNMNIGVCRGDSGSPLVCRRGNDYVLAGIVSFTSRQRPESFPAVFTKVTDYIPWIEQVTGIRNF